MNLIANPNPVAGKIIVGIRNHGTQVILVAGVVWFGISGTLPVSAQTNIQAVAGTNQNDEIRQLQQQLAVQTERIDRLYEALGPQLAEMEERAAALKQQQADDQALAMHEVFRLKDDNLNSKLIFIPGSRWLGAARNDDQVWLYQLPDGNAAARINGLDGEPLCLAAASSSGKIFIGTRTGSIYVCQTNGANLQKVFDWSGWPVTALAVNPDGTRAACACNGKYDANGTWTKPEDSLVAFDVNTGKRLWTGQAGRCDFQALSFQAGGKMIAAVENRMVRLLDAATGRTVRELSHPDYPSGPLSCALSQDGNVCAIGYAPNNVGIWNATEGRCLRLLKAHSNWVVALAFSPDDAFLASGSGDGTACVWDVASGKAVGRLRFGDGPSYVNSVSISDDGQWLTAGRRGEFVVLDMPKKLGANK